MKQHEILSLAPQLKIRFAGSTRAALLGAAVEGVYAASGARPAVDAPLVERPFSIKSDDSNTLLVDFLNHTLSESAKHKEAYRDVTFARITDAQAEGALLGCPCADVETRITNAKLHGVDVAKNDEGLWTATVEFDV